jgi:Holliday junction DNA helicase RuvB
MPDQPAKGTSYLTTTLTAPVSPAEAALRPLSFSDFAGQQKTVDRLKIMVSAAKRRGDALNHILFSGPPGLGKTTLAFILGHELGRNVRVTSGPVIEKAGDLAGLLTNLEEGDLLFIDEIHRIPKTVEEYLYSAMEDFRLDIMIDQGPNARSVRLSIPKFTLVGATTRAGLLTAPLRSRFTLQTRLDYYDAPTLIGIVRRTCGLLKSPRAPAAPRASSTTSSTSSATTRRKKPTARSRSPSPPPRWRCWRSMPAGSMKWTSASCACWPRITAAAPPV